MTDSQPPREADRAPELGEPESGVDRSWMGEVARTIRDIVDNNARTARTCILIAAATAAWAFFR